MVLERKFKSRLDQQTELLNQQIRMDQELRSKSKVSEIEFDINANQFVIPQYEGGNYITRTVSIPPTSAEHIKFIFTSLNRANYLIFVENKGNITHKKQAHTICPKFINFMCTKQSNIKDRIKILKQFETHRVNVEKVKPQSSGLYAIKFMIKLAIEDEVFRKELSEAAYNYLFKLTKTKSSPFTEADNLNLAAWIGEHTWLRRDDVGIGHALYARLASPKATMKSFIATVEIAMLETLKAKEALMDLISVTSITTDRLTRELTRSQYSRKSSHDVHVRKCFLETFDVLRGAFHSLKKPSKDLETAIKIFLSENIRATDLKRYDDAFFSNKPGFNSVSIVTARNKLFFSGFFLYELAEYVNSDNKKELPVPACHGEHLLFHWLMATQTVQASDIAKLSRNNFQLVRRRNGKVTHIRNEYYKGRAQTTHNTKEISTNSALGNAILLFILQRTPINDSATKLSVPLKSVGVCCSFGRFINFLNTCLFEKISAQVNREKSSLVFLKAMTKLLENGVTKKAEFKTVSEFWRHCETPCKTFLFKPSSIKTAAVYASSDTFDPTQLTNFHSHTDKTERKCYLTPNNEEWLNNTGLITRAVMQDLTVNLFSASQSEKQAFNSHFTNASEYISAKTDETLARMKLLTGKEDGKVDDLGFLTDYRDAHEPSDTIYLIDSPETVMKLRHFLSEVKNKHHILAKSSPDYLLMNVLPTVEWIETLFQYKRFSTLDEGDELYQKYSAILPPLFSTYIR